MRSKDWIEQEVKRLGETQPWWHDIQLPHGVRTIGRQQQGQRANHNAEKWDRFKTHVNLQGQSVIDLGCNEGAFGHWALAAGATRVLGIDINSQRIEKARFVADVLNADKIDFREASVYQLDAEDVGGRFDVAFALGLLHRVPDPYGMLMKISSLADAAVFEWSASSSNDAVMEFWGGGYKDYDRHNTGYWRISRQCVREILMRTEYTVYADIEPSANRAIMAAAKSPESLCCAGQWKPLAETSTAPAKSKSFSVSRFLQRLFFGGRRRAA